MDTETLSDEQWAIIKGVLDERDVNQLKLAYAYSRRQLTVQAETSHYNGITHLHLRRFLMADVL